MVGSLYGLCWRRRFESALVLPWVEQGVQWLMVTLRVLYVLPNDAMDDCTFYLSRKHASSVPSSHAYQQRNISFSLLCIFDSPPCSGIAANFRGHSESVTWCPGTTRVPICCPWGTSIFQLENFPIPIHFPSGKSKGFCGKWKTVIVDVFGQKIKAVFDYDLISVPVLALWFTRICAVKNGLPMLIKIFAFGIWAKIIMQISGPPPRVEWPITTTPIGPLPLTPARMTCPNCSAQIITEIMPVIGSLVWLLVLVLCLVG